MSEWLHISWLHWYGCFSHEDWVLSSWTKISKFQITSHSRLLSGKAVGRQRVWQRLQQKPRRFELKLKRWKTTFRPGAESHVQCAVYLVGCMPFSVSQTTSQRLAPESAQSQQVSKEISAKPFKSSFAIHCCALWDLSSWTRSRATSKWRTLSLIVCVPVGRCILYYVAISWSCVKRGGRMHSSRISKVEQIFANNTCALLEGIANSWDC